MRLKKDKVRKKKSIMTTLLAAFLVPVAMMVVLGLVSYNTASSAILAKYSESAVSTVSAVGNYCNLVCNSISGKALEMVSNSDLRDYYEKLYRKQDSQAMEAFRGTKTLINNVRSTNGYIYSCSVIPENGSYTTTLTGSMTGSPYTDFEQSAQGRFFEQNPTVKKQWMGYHTYLDGNLSSTPDKYALVFYQKMLKNNTVLVMDIDMKVVNDMLNQMDFGDGSIKALISGDGRETAVVQGKEEAAKEETYFVGSEFFEQSRTAEETGSKSVKIDGSRYVYIYTPVGTTGAMICALIPRSNLLSQVGSIRILTIFMVILAAAAAMVTGGIISNGISKVVKSMTRGLEAVAQGDLSGTFCTGRNDEFKVLTGSLNSMLDSMKLVMLEMKQFGTKVSAMAIDVSDKTGGISSSVRNISIAMDEVAKGVQNQAEETENSNEKMVVFAENINTVTDRTQNMSETADKAREAVDKGRVIVQELSSKSDTTVSLTKVFVEDIDEVQKQSAEIQSFVDMISSIAEQTNLLSLNASIEAARAGESGKGFAVVAEEIRKLADQSKESGDQIREIVKNIAGTTEKTTISAKKTEEMIHEQAVALEHTVEVFGMIHNCVIELTEGIGMIAGRLGKIMTEKDQIQDSIQNISSVSEEVAASAQEVTATLGEQVSVIHALLEEVEALKSDARELEQSIGKFKI